MNPTFPRRFHALEEALGSGDFARRDIREARSGTPGEEFREQLVNVTSCLAIYAGIEERRLPPGAPEWWSWERIARALFEAYEDLQHPAPLGEPLVGSAAILALVSEGLDLVRLDREFHSLLSLYLQDCILINLLNGACRDGDNDLEPSRKFRLRIRDSLDYIAKKVDERGRRRSREPA